MCDVMDAYASRMDGHDECLDRAAEDPAARADPRVAERLRLMAAVARTTGNLARLAGVPSTPTDHEETARVG